MNSQEAAKLIGERIEEAQGLRGWLINSYAQIEFLLGAFIRKSVEHKCYSNLGNTLPHKITERVKRVRRILAIEGPLSIYEPLLDYVMKRLLQGDETRNLLAHGFCQYVFTGSDDWGMRFTKWHRERSQPDAILRMTRDFRVDDLRSESRRMSDLAQQMVVSLGELEQKYSTAQ